MMFGQMMEFPLLISTMLTHAERYTGEAEIVSRMVDGSLHRYTYRDAHKRTKQLANALVKLGVNQGDRIGTLAWNTHRHFEAYFGIAGIGAISHTVNPRLFPEQISYIINHASDRFLFVDETFVPTLEAISDQLTSVEKIFVLTANESFSTKLKNWEPYESLIKNESVEFEWPQFDERSASSLCYTSGTTGNPKGVLYSHRSTLLHAYTAAMPDGLSVSNRDVVLPVVPMFHVNAWGLPYICSMMGAKIVFPGPFMDGASICQLINDEKATLSAGVPTIWSGVLNYLDEKKLSIPSLKRVVIGGSACPEAMIRTFLEKYQVDVVQGWGMTELSPLGTMNTLKANQASLTDDEKIKLKAKQGRVLFGIDMKIIDETGDELPWDGKAFGDLLVRGPNVLSNYFQNEDPILIKDKNNQEWFATGDVATIDPDGFMHITDRSKDVIKSGGEWISSIELENTAVAHPDVLEAAVIAAYHPKWEERPLLIVVKKSGTSLQKDELLNFFEGKVAKWWMPDDVVFIDEIPHTATGKILKTKLREDFRDYKLPEK
jgi:acyl-CoA synthetase (AMP-forming)/AMP-acid ligase II